MKKIVILAHASSGLASRGTRAEQTRPGQATSFDNTRPAPRAGESMGEYLRRAGTSTIGATARTRGTPARVVRTRGNR